jgi:hypothetical protein
VSTTATSGSASSLTLSTTTLTDNAWTVAVIRTAGALSSPSAGTGTTLRGHRDEYGLAMIDSNGPKSPAGAKSLILNFGTTIATSHGVIAAFCPSSGCDGGDPPDPPATVPCMLSLLGVGKCDFFSLR